MATDDGTTETGGGTGTTTEQRSVEELRKLTTYQGMTDAEVQSLVDYYRQQSYQQGYSACETSAQQTQQAQLTSDSQAAWEAAQKSLETATSTAATFQTLVQDNIYKSTAGTDTGSSGTGGNAQ